jgi:hypothetical protein
MGAPRKYTLNENYFEIIDSEEKSYWLGFIYADGFITKRKPGHGQHVLGITLAEKDHVEKFANSIGTNKPVKTYEKKNAFGKKNGSSYEHKLALISNKLVSDIEKLGVVENKTFLLSEIPTIPKEYIKDFIRGYFDGDGSVFIINRKAPRNTKNGLKIYTGQNLGITICGTFKFLNSLVEEINEPDIPKTCIYKELRRQTDTWSIKLASDKRSWVFYNYIYGHNPKIYMARKKEKFESLIKTEI